MQKAAYECNGQIISRQAFYAIACDPRRSVAVEACAGAGKTWMLVSRILRALLDGSAPHEILAITFTKKAAGEMRQRLQEWLHAFAEQDLPTLAQELMARGMEPHAAREHSAALQQLYRHTLEAGRPVQIRTFHSWFAALLATAPFAVLEHQGLPAQYELLEDESHAISEVWRPFLRTVAGNPELRADYEASIACYGHSSTHDALKDALQRRVEFLLADANGAVTQSVESVASQFPELAGGDDPALALLHSQYSALQAAAQALGRASQPSYAAKGTQLETALSTEDADSMLDALLTKEGKERKFNDSLNGISAIRHAQTLCERAQQARIQHAAWQHQQRMTRLTHALIAQFATLKRERGWIDMPDVERTALAMLSDPILSGWVQERLDTRVRHLLVDEFQDTSPLQWQALHAWLSGYAGAGGGQLTPSVFIVGDPKQSIYRFRRAEPQVFIAAQRFIREGLEGSLLACDHTRRNASRIISTVNNAMQAASSEGNYHGFRPHTTESPEAGQLLRLPPIQPIAKKVEEKEKFQDWRDSLTQARHEAETDQRMYECTQAAHWIAARIEVGIPAGEIMVLARKRDRLNAMQNALRALHIPCVQPEKAALAAQPEVQDIIALLDALVSPTHNLSLARALKSPVFGIDDAALVHLAKLAQETGSHWFTLLQHHELPAPAPKGIGARLARYREWIDNLPPHDALQAIYQHSDILARYAAATPATQRERTLAHLRALLTAALHEGGGRYLTPYAFVRAMKRSNAPIPSRADDHAVRLLTIHGAKGLEADTVLLLDTDAVPQKAATMTTLIDWPGEQSAPLRFVFLASENHPPPSVTDMLAAERAERQREELNALYVAMTRARQCLVISCSQAKKPNPTNWWGRLADNMEEEEIALSGTARSSQVTDISLFELPVAATLPATLVKETQPEKDQASLAARQGQAMHQLLEQVGPSGTAPHTLAQQGWPSARLARLARDFDLTAQATTQAAAIAARILQGEGAWAWDISQIDHAINEAPLTHNGQLLRIDRLVRRKGQGGWWILDYKSATQPETQPALRAQLHQYCQAVRTLLPGEAIRAAFLTGDGRMVMVEQSHGEGGQGELF